MRSSQSDISNLEWLGAYLDGYYADGSDESVSMVRADTSFSKYLSGKISIERATTSFKQRRVRDAETGTTVVRVDDSLDARREVYGDDIVDPRNLVDELIADLDGDIMQQYRCFDEIVKGFRKVVLKSPEKYPINDFIQLCVLAMQEQENRKGKEFGEHTKQLRKFIKKHLDVAQDMISICYVLRNWIDYLDTDSLIKSSAKHRRVDEAHRMVKKAKKATDNKIEELLLQKKALAKIIYDAESNLKEARNIFIETYLQTDRIKAAEILATSNQLKNLWTEQYGYEDFEIYL